MPPIKQWVNLDPGDAKIETMRDVPGEGKIPLERCGPVVTLKAKITPAGAGKPIYWVIELGADNLSKKADNQNVLAGWKGQGHYPGFAAPKFYFADVGVVNHLARRGELHRGSELYGKAFENWVFHELRAHNTYGEAFARLSYWRLASGIEVDFIVNDMQVAIEAKATAKVTSDHLKGLRSLVQDHPRTKQRVVVCLERQSRRTEDGIRILAAADFYERLSAGDLF